MTARENLIQMLADIRAHQRPKETLLAYYVEERLNKTVNIYYKSVLSSAKVLERADPLNKKNPLVAELDETLVERILSTYKDLL